MRIWSVHPKYLDTKGLVALWRETLLAKHVLEGNTKGYRNHPQLSRFRSAENPINSINLYLSIVYNEAIKREFNFDKNKISWNFYPVKINVTKEQMKFETTHLLNKLKIRDKKKYNELSETELLDPNPVFCLIDGEIEEWEKTK
jgi:hypothetical protein